MSMYCKHGYNAYCVDCEKCKTEKEEKIITDAFAWFGRILVDTYEDYFPGGENQIIEMSNDFLEVYKRHKQLGKEEWTPKPSTNCIVNREQQNHNDIQVTSADDYEQK